MTNHLEFSIDLLKKKVEDLEIELLIKENSIESLKNSKEINVNEKNSKENDKKNFSEILLNLEIEMKKKDEIIMQLKEKENLELPTSDEGILRMEVNYLRSSNKKLQDEITLLSRKEELKDGNSQEKNKKELESEEIKKLKKELSIALIDFRDQKDIIDSLKDQVNILKDLHSSEDSQTHSFFESKNLFDKISTKPDKKNLKINSSTYKIDEIDNESERTCKVLCVNLLDSKKK